MGDLTPADAGYPLQKLVDQMRDFETRIARLEWATRVVVSRATVTGTAVGNMCNVQFAGTGQTRAVPFLKGYTPAISDIGDVFDTGASIVFVPVSAYL